MNFFRRIYCRTYQFVFKILIPFLPYREPKILSEESEVVKVLKESNKQRVLFVADKGVKNLGLTKSLEEELSKNEIKLFIYDGTVPNPTTDNVAEALEIYKKNNCQAIIAFGGGSVLDCAKATGALVARPKKTLGQMKGVLKVRKKIPLLIAVPTTAGTGSETTLATVIVDSKTRHKYAINDFPLIPSYALLDAKLTTGLPKHITATTGMDALTHAVEAYIGRSTTKKTRKFALDAVKLVLDNLLTAYENGKDLKARQNMLIGAYKAGVAFTTSYVGYIHAIAHTIGGKYDIGHGLANAVIMPYVLKKYGKKVHKKLWKLGVYAGLFTKEVSKEEGARLFIEKIEELNEKMNIPKTLPQIKEEDIDNLAKTAEKEANPLYPVPTLYTVNDLKEIYTLIKG